VLKAFVLCQNIVDHPEDNTQKDLYGAGFRRIEAGHSFPVKLSFWAYIQLSDEKEWGELRLALMRADSGRRYFFRTINVRHPDPVEVTATSARIYQCVFPEPGVYFVELWYDGEWILDQRLEVV
jgi:hypothetical protein